MAEKMTMTQFDAYLKDVYPDNTLLTQFNDEKEFYKLIEKSGDTLNYSGRKAVFPLLQSWGGGNGSVGEDEDLPTAGATPNAVAEVTLMYHYNRKYITNQTIKAALGGNSSVISGIELMYEAQMNALLKDYNWKLFNSSTGLRTRGNGALTGITADFVVDSVKGFSIGMLIDVYDNSNASTQATDVEVLDINESTKTLTLDTMITCDDNSYVYQAGEKGKSLNGLYDAYQTTGTYHALARSGNTWWQGKVVSSSAVPISDTLLTPMRREAQMGAKPKIWLTTFEIKDKIWENILRQQQNLVNVVTIAGGVETFKYHGFTVVPDSDCTAGLIALIDPSMFTIVEDKDGFHWAEQGGSRLYPVSGKDSHETLFRNYSNMIVKKPRYMPVCTGILES